MIDVEKEDVTSWSMRSQELGGARLRIVTDGKTVEFEFSEDDLSPRKVVVSAARARRLFAQVDDALETLEGA